MCDCVSVLTEQLKEHNTEFDTVLYLSGDEWQSRIKIAMRKIEPRGQKPINLMINYCPFCGEKVEKE